MQYLILIALASFLILKPSETIKLKYQSKFKTNVPEPSDISFFQGTYYCVSDNGLLFKISDKGQITQKAEFKGVDFEALVVVGDDIYVSDETVRRIYRFRRDDLSLHQTYTVTFHGGNNSGFESLTYNPIKNRFILISESPTTLYEMDENFRTTFQKDLIGLTDVSSVTYFENKIWVLSDEDMTVSRLNAENYTLEKKIKIPVHNPEGITFDNEKNLIICSDDLRTIYKFNAQQIFE